MIIIVITILLLKQNRSKNSYQSQYRPYEKASSSNDPSSKHVTFKIIPSLKENTRNHQNQKPTDEKQKLKKRSKSHKKQIKPIQRKKSTRSIPPSSRDKSKDKPLAILDDSHKWKPPGGVDY